MTMRVEVTITGLAMGFTANDAWSVYLVCDADHMALYSAQGSNPVPLHQQGIDRDLLFVSKGLISKDPIPGPGFDQIFNLAADYAHGPGNLKLVRSGNSDLVTARIPSATIETVTLTDRNYYIQDVSSYVGAPPKIIPQVAMVIKGTFEVSDDLDVSIVDNSGSQLLSTFRYVDNTTINIELNNDCQVEPQRNDSLDLYDFVQDPRGYKFATGQVRNSPSHGDCDPVIVYPPPDDGGV
jgi:hypothetical protein